jgi:SH3-like domain-containing protein
MRAIPHAPSRTLAGARRPARGWKRIIAISCLAQALACVPVAANPLQPQAPVETGRAKGRETGLPVPRFVSLKSREARMRVGPSLDYGTQWVYQVAGLPVEITAEYGNWRQIRDCDGVSGWMHRALLSSNRTALVGPWIASTVPIRAAPTATALILAKLTSRVRLAIHACDGTWCSVEVPGHRLDGFVRQSALWGVYPNEKIM